MSRIIIFIFCALLVACNGSQSTNALQSASIGSSQTGVKVGDRLDGIQVVSRLPKPQSNSATGAQAIASNDVLEIDVFGVNELDRTVQVDSQGKIALPLIGEVEAKGKTVRQLEQTLKSRYGRNYLESPQISVFMKESVGQRVTVDGEVKKAGIYPVSANTSLVDIIAVASGLTDIADEKKLYVFRNYGDKRLVANYDLKKIRAGQTPDPQLYGGDVVVVFTSSSKIAMKNLRDALGVARTASLFVP